MEPFFSFAIFVVGAEIIGKPKDLEPSTIEEPKIRISWALVEQLVIWLELIPMGEHVLQVIDLVGLLLDAYQLLTTFFWVVSKVRIDHRPG